MRYTFDSLGRPLGIRRPDTTNPLTQSGVDMSYAQLVTTTTEFTNGSGNAAQTKRTLDADGRLVKVEEKSITNGVTSWYATQYAYGPDNNVKQITDPENKITLLTHNQAGQRTRIDRNGRQWDYTYDKDGNVESEIAPCTPQPTCRAAFTTTMLYDSVDRMVIKYIAPRLLSVPDQTLFGAAQESFVYDTGNNGRGRMQQWHSWGPGNVEKQNQAFWFDAQGRVLTDWMSFNAAGFSAVRYVEQSYLLGGAPLRTSYHEPANGGSVATVSDLAYDARGLPQSVSISTNGGTTFRPAIVETRNLAGLVTKRRVDYPGSPPMTYAESVWTYDKLGRILDQTVNRAPGTPVQVARQALTYLGNDDLSTLTTSFGTTAKLQTFTYDYRHQLTDAVVSPASKFHGTYSYGPAGRFTQAVVTQTAPPSPTEIVPRNVFYNYAGTDPELVTSLTTGSFGGTPYVTYTYDAAGNQLTRAEAVSGDSYDYLYDGKDQLRRATKKHGATVLGSEEYWYDSSGARSQVVKRGGTGTISEMVWFQGGTEGHYAANGTVTHAYSHVSLGTPVARIDRTNDSTTTTEYQFHGLASSTLTAISSTGTINATFHYAPFGEVIESTNAGAATGAGTAAHKRRFNDKQQDDLTALSYYGARYYDRMLLGWTQIDPLYLRVPDLGKQSTPRRSNLAAFSLNNPIRYLDPDGTDSTNNLSHWTDTFNDDRRNRVMADGGDDVTGTMLERYRWEAMWAAGSGGARGADGTNTSNACDGVHGVCEDWFRDTMADLTGKDLGPDPVESFITGWVIGKLVPGYGQASTAKDLLVGEMGPEWPNSGSPPPPPPPPGRGGPSLSPTATSSPQLSSPQQKAIDILRPGGRLIGSPGSNKTIRQLGGGQDAAIAMFKNLVRRTGATISHKDGLDGYAELAGGGSIGYRAISTFGSGPPTISVRIPGLSIREVKFFP